MVRITSTTFGVYTQEAVARRWRSTMARATGVAYGLAYAVAGLGGGALITALGYRPMFALTAVLPAMGALVLWAAMRETRAKVEETLQAEGGQPAGVLSGESH